MMPSIQDLKVKATSSTEALSGDGAAEMVVAERRSTKSENIGTEEYIVTTKEAGGTQSGMRSCETRDDCGWIFPRHGRLAASIYVFLKIHYIM
jgi:hypothetical protein